MYNTDLPHRADLPTTAQLKRSTAIAIGIAAAILALVVLPSEYAIDPTGVGRLLGLTEMGQIKAQLTEEARRDAVATATANSTTAAVSDQALVARLDRIEALLQGIGGSLTTSGVNPSAAPIDDSSAASIPEEISKPVPTVEQPSDDRSAVVSAEPAGPAANAWQDELSFELTPGEGVEVKMVMEEGSQTQFFWTANGAVVNYDTHGDGGGNNISYEKGREVGEQEGVLEAAFTGNHGWFWRNRTNDPITLTVRTRGDYSNIKRM